MKSKLAIARKGVPTVGLYLLFLLCALLGVTQVMAQVPIRIINPSGGGAGDPGLRIEVYADGSYHVFRDGKRETYEGSDQLSWQTTASNIRGAQHYIAIVDDNNIVPAPAENNLHQLQPAFVSPVYGSGTSTDPWKIQLMGTNTQTNYMGSITYSFVIILNYIKDNNYFQTDYLLYFSDGNLSNADVSLYQTERLVMGADPTDLQALTNSECAMGYISGEENSVNVPIPSIVAGYRTGSCGGSVPYPRSHVLKLNQASVSGGPATFNSFFIGDAQNRMNLVPGIVQQVLTDNMQTAPATGSYTGISASKIFSVGEGEVQWEWGEEDADNYHHLSMSTRFLTGYGTTPTDFTMSSGKAPSTDASEPVKVGFLNATVKITEGNALTQVTTPMLYITRPKGILKTDLMLELDTVAIPVAQGDGSMGAPATDYKYRNGVLLKKFTASIGSASVGDTIKIPLDSFFINGNMALEYNRAFKFKIKSNHGLISVDPGKDTCRVIIVDDEPRDLTLTPLATTLQEGDVATIRASLPTGITTANPVTVNLHLHALANTSGFSIPATALIPSGGDHVDFTLTTLTDNILERDDTLHISADGQILGQSGSSVMDAVFILKDKTRTNPDNLKITFDPATATLDKGQANQHITASLPAGITTAIPIDITLSNDATSNADASSYTMPLHIFIDSSNNSGSLTYQTLIDNIVYGPLVKHLVLTGSAVDTVGNAFTLTNGIDIGINDKNWPLSGNIIFNRSASTIDEGAGTSTLSLTLPNNLVAGRDFDFTISNTSSLATGQHVLNGMPTDAVHITEGNKSVSFATISTPVDAIVGNNELVTFTATSNTVAATSIGSATMNIVDKTVVGPAVQITFTPVVSTVAEGQKTAIKIQLEGSKTLPQPLTLAFSIIDGTTTAGDAVVFTNTYTLPANTNSATVNDITLANADAIIEGDETFQITATPTGPAVVILPASVTITDMTRKNALQTALTVSGSPATWTKGDTRTLTVKLPSGTTTQVPITVNYVRDAASVVGAAGVILPATPIIIDAGTTATTFQVQLPTDLEVYGPLTRHLILDGSAADGALPVGAFTAPVISFDVNDNNWPLTHPLVISAGSITEGGAAFTNSITLPDGLIAGRDLDFTVSNTNSLTLGQHVIPQPGAITITSGNPSASIAAVSTPVDIYIGNDEDVTFAAVYTGTGSAADAPVTSGAVHITDATHAASLGISITPSPASLEEGQSGDVTVSLTGGLQLLQPITITLTPQLSGTLTASDFVLNTTTLTLPAGATSKTFTGVFTAQTDQVLEADEVLQLKAVVSSGPAVTIPNVAITIKDKTHNIPGATTLTVTASASSVVKGGSITLTIALPSPYTTETPIATAFTWDNTSTTGSSGYTLASPVVLSTGSSTTTTLLINSDKVVYGPDIHQLQLQASASDAASTYTVNGIAVAVTDNNWPLVHPLVISTGNITEGGTAFTNTITLPDGLIAGRNLDFNVTNTNGIVLGAHVIPQPGTVTIASGSSFANIENVATPVDQFVGNDEAVTFAATYTGAGQPANAVVSNGIIHITDATSSSLNLVLTPASTTLNEDNTPTDVTLSIAGGLVLLQPLTVQLSPVLSGTTTAADFTLNTTTLTLPAGTVSATFSGVLQANSDLVLENTESLKIKGTVTSGPAATVPDMNFAINDLTHNTAANLVLNISHAASSLIKGESTALDILLPEGVTTEIPISVNLGYDPVSTVASSGYSLSAASPITFSSGSGTSLTLTASTDNIVYGPDPLQLKLDATASDAVKPFTINGIVVSITDNHWPLAHPLVISSGSITEGGTAYTNTITLPDGLQAGRDLTFDITNTNGITTGKHIIPQPGTITIPAGSKGANIANVSTPIDSYVGNDEDVTFSATYTGAGAPADATVSSGTVHIIDATSAALGLTLTPATSTLNEDNTPTAVTLAISGGITLLQPLTVQLTAVNSGTVTAADYTLLQTTLTLPAGTTTQTFPNVLQANSDAVLEGTETLKITGTITTGQEATVPDMNIDIHDLTHNDPANLVLTVTPAATTVAKGSGTTLTIALPTGITTEIPISIQFGYDGTSTVSSTGYTLGSNPVVLSTGNSTTVPLQFPSDHILFWPLVNTLKLSTSASDAVKPYTINPVSVDETDNNYPLQHPLTISQGTINEGDAPAPVTITLPDGLQAGHDMSFTVSNVNSLTVGTHGVTSPAAPVIIVSGAQSATIEPVSVPVDNYIGNDEDVTFSATGNFTVTDGVLHIVDKTGDHLTLSLFASNNLDEGMKSHIGVQLEGNLILLQPLTIQFSAVDSTTKPGDYTLLQNTVTIPAGEDSHVFADMLAANTDQVLEATEYLKLSGVVTSGQSITVPDIRFKINDITHTIAANTAITLTPSAPSPWTKGDSRQLTVSLPAGVTTEVPIVINTLPAAGSELQADAYALPLPITLGSGHDTTVSFDIYTDNKVYGPQTQRLHLVGNAADNAFSSYTVSDVNLDIIDNNYATLGSLILVVDDATITEGGAATHASLSLPGSLVAGRALAFSINTLSSLTVGGHAINWPTDSIRFASGDHSITFAMPQAAFDKVMGNDEDITISAAGPGFTVTDATLHISDATAGDPLTSVVTLSSSSNVQEGQGIPITASLAPGVTSAQPVIITLAANAASVAGSDDYTLPTTLTIPAGSNSGSITLDAATDHILEPDELLRIDGSTTSYPGLLIHSVAVNITDATSLDPANLVLQITIDSSSIYKGNATTVHVGFANPDITSSVPLNIAITAAAASTAAASDYAALPAPLTLPAGENSVSFTLQTLNDNLTEGPVTLLLAGNANGYTVNASEVLNILESTPMAVSVLHGKDGAEPGTDGGFVLKLPGTTMALNDITVNLRMDNTGGTDNFILPATQYTIPQGFNSINIPVVIKDDYLIQGDGAVTATLQSASITVAGVTYPVGIDSTPAIVYIHDDESDTTGAKADARKIVIEKVSDARKPDSIGAFRVHFADERLSVVKDVQVTYSVSGDAIPDADYHALPGTVTIPALQTGVVVPVLPILNQNVFNDVTATITLEQVSSSLPAFNWMLSDTATVANILIRDNNGVPDTAMQIIGPNPWTDDSTRKIRVHPALSPNGDGVGNDAMYIENINKFPENEVTVFNRWGATVFHTLNYTNIGNNFAGRYNTNGSGDVPEGTYYYIIYINDQGKRERYTGFVVIRR
ncbi:gliding motility-associated C-terminal domain-containing protein [Chitinophaga costaii]|nr:gliding motility-associated C-terminal domain-containing protein [Chitinophaga costaii]